MHGQASRDRFGERLPSLPRVARREQNAGTFAGYSRRKTRKDVIESCDGCLACRFAAPELMYGHSLP